MEGQVRKRPAETTTAAGGVALLAAVLLGLDAEAASLIGVALTAVPAVVTWVVNRGGLLTLARRFLGV